MSEKISLDSSDVGYVCTYRHVPEYFRDNPGTSNLHSVSGC